MICQIQYFFFFCPFDILQYKFLSYREVLHVLSESSEISQLSELIELPEVFSSMEKCLLHQALRPGDPLIKLLELRFVSSSSETSRSSGTIQASQSSISSHPVFPDAGWVGGFQFAPQLLGEVIQFGCSGDVRDEGSMIQSSDSNCSASSTIPKHIARCGLSSCCGVRTGRLLQSVTALSE